MSACHAGGGFEVTIFTASDPIGVRRAVDRGLPLLRCPSPKATIDIRALGDRTRTRPHRRAGARDGTLSPAATAVRRLVALA